MTLWVCLSRFPVRDEPFPARWFLFLRGTSEPYRLGQADRFDALLDLPRRPCGPLRPLRRRCSLPVVWGSVDRSRVLRDLRSYPEGGGLRTVGRRKRHSARLQNQSRRRTRPPPPDRVLPDRALKAIRREKQNAIVRASNPVPSPDMAEGDHTVQTTRPLRHGSLRQMPVVHVAGLALGQFRLGIGANDTIESGTADSQAKPFAQSAYGAAIPRWHVGPQYPPERHRIRAG